jgi:hypothetical protein
MKVYEIVEQRSDEAAPIVVGGVVLAARWLFGFAIKRGGPPLLQWLARKAVKWGLISAAVVAGAEWTWEKIKEILGEDIVNWLIENNIEIAVVITLILASVALRNFLKNKNDNDNDIREMNSIIEMYKQKDGDYARPGKMPSKKKRGPHPLGGKLVGETASAGATGAGAVASVANPSTKKKKNWKPTDNALDMKNTSLFGTKLIKR